MTDTKPQLNYVFDDFADMFVELGAFGTPSELHGLLTGQLAAGVRADAEAWLAMVVAHLDVQAIEDDDDKAELVVLYDMVLEQLTEANFGLQLLLPEDDAELAGRTESLGAWCTGFLVGFGLGFDHSTQKLSSESTYSMEDLANIAQVSFDAEDEDLTEDSAEISYVELVEYVRLAAMMVFAEFNLLAESGPQKVPQQLH